MQQSKFHELWQTFVLDFLNSPKSACLHEAYKDKRITLRWDSEAQVYQRYERIKDLFKANYFKDIESTTLDRHKRASIIVYAFIDVSPVNVESIKPVEPIQLRLANECIAFYFGLHYLTIDYKSEAIDRVINNLNSVFFKLPNNHFPLISEQCVEDNHYAICIWKELFFSKEYRNYNILSMSNIFYLLEVNHCTLLPDELYDDLKPESALRSC